MLKATIVQPETFETTSNDNVVTIISAVKTGAAVLMTESLVFALIAFLKLLMYIKAYGFTPLRFQSTWLVIVLIMKLKKLTSDDIKKIDDRFFDKMDMQGMIISVLR